MHHIFTAEYLRKFHIAAEQQTDNLSEDIHAALEPFCQHPTPNLPGTDFQSLYTQKHSYLPVQLYPRFQHELELWHPALPSS